MLETAISFIAGTGVTWFAAWHYYKKAGNELRDEASRLRRTSEMILRWLETEGTDIKVLRNEDGSPIGLARSVADVAELEFGVSLVSGQLTKEGGDSGR